VKPEGELVRIVGRVLLGIVLISVALVVLLGVSILIPDVGCQQSVSDYNEMKTLIRLQAPAEIDARESFSINGTLYKVMMGKIGAAPVANVGFPGQRIGLTVGAMSTIVHTDEGGHFSYNLSLDHPGSYRIQASYSGDQLGYIRASQSILPLSVTGDTASRSNSWQLYLLAAAALAVISYLLYRYIIKRDGLKAAREIENRVTPGKVDIRNLRSWLRPIVMVIVIALLIFALWPREQPQTVVPDDRTLIVSTIILDVPETTGTGESFDIKGTLTGTDNNTEYPLSSEEVSIVIVPVGGGNKNTEKVMTDEVGGFTEKIILEESGEYEISAVFENTRGIYFTSSDSRNIVVHGMAEPSSWDLSGMHWIFSVFGFLVVATLLIIGVIYYRRYRRSHPSTNKIAVTDEIDEPLSFSATSEESILEKHTPDSRLKIEFPQIGASLPDVWGQGESLAIQFTTDHENGQKTGGEELDIELLPGLKDKAVVDDEGQLTREHTYSMKGEYEIKAAFFNGTLSSHDTISRSVRIVDYREEIVRLYTEVVALLDASGLTVSPRMTVRDMENILLRILPALSREKVDQFASLFEEANYSLHQITRSTYERMYQICIEVKKNRPVKFESQDTRTASGPGYTI